MNRLSKLALAVGIATLASSCQAASKSVSFPSGTTGYSIDADSLGYVQSLGPLKNLVVISRDENNLKAEYEAGFIQGQLQRDQLPATRDNLWDTIARVDPGYPKRIPPSATETAVSTTALLENYNYTLGYIRRAGDPTLRERLSRLVFRMYGIYHGAVHDSPEQLDFSGAWLPDEETFDAGELMLNYETAGVSFLDIYFINAIADLMDYTDNEYSRSKCSAFIKRTPGEIFLAHNSWFSYLDESMASTYVINDTFVTVNALTPGNILSNTDFGYNGKGIAFNETTHYASYTEPKVDKLWMFWRGALAEQFASSLDEFFELASLEASGTYMNGYGIFDVSTKQIGLVEMSYKDFVFFRSDASGGYEIKTKPEGVNTAYDHELLQPDVIIGVNFPASLAIREQLQSVENRPMRRKQFLERMGTVTDTAAARALITYTAPNEPLSIYGRWDLGFGTTPKPKTIPEGSIDAKALNSSDVRAGMKLSGTYGGGNTHPMFWMKYGTPPFPPPNGKPFIWSESQWSNQKLRGVPNVVTGDWHEIRAAVA